MTIFDSLYDAYDERDREIFGDLYQPKVLRFEHGVETEILRLAGTGDGQDVVVTETRMPARAFAVHVAALPDREFQYLGLVKGKPAVVISTGTGDEMGALALAIAKAIAKGMLGVDLP